MRDSVPEPRPDGKASPMVGAVLVKPDGTIQTACRGELRHGDHAEFGLLERKNRDTKLDGSVLFVTLEPCAPGARRHPKLGCAERIVLARIKEMWIGIQDPDPTVARKGIAHLEAHGVVVHMFDRDLQEEIERENSAFLEQALERAAAAEETLAPKVLSPLENQFPAAVLSDFSDEALGEYCRRAQVSESLDSAEFSRRLVRQGLLKEDGGQAVPTGFGLLLFGKEPRTAMRQAGLLVLLSYPDGTQERREFDQPAVLIPALLEKWLGDKLPNVLDRTTTFRKEQSGLPFEMVREAVVNALIHRDYSIDGAKCQLVVNADTVTVKSPGPPPPPITLDQLASFTAPMLSRNPVLHFVFARMGMAEEQGLGLASLRDRAQAQGLPLPQYTWNPPYLELTLYRSAGSAVRRLAPNVLDSLSEDEKRGWEYLATLSHCTRKAYQEHAKVDARKAQRHFKRFVDLGLLRTVGGGRSTSYDVVRP